ncbi:MAG: hypothetical protein D6719_13855 [Candidatus Dadabacteria bacterium]|nr:MAG: hypothetical protein D6719_13855 [Candidatus Dadabacteria bacterium]
MKELPQDPRFRYLVKALEKMPEYLEERSRKIRARREFVKAVFEDAVKKSGIMQHLKRHE